MSSGERRVVVPTPRPVAVREIQLIDRDEEMQLLRDAADRAARGEGGVIFLHGEAGIGKTRLARELGAYARSQGMKVLSGRCPALFRMDGVPPYVLWEEVIKEYLETCTPEQLFRVVGSYPVEVSKLVPDLKQKLRTFPQSFPLSPEHSRDRLFEAVSQFITNISKETPLLVVLDDLQWTDQSSLLLLHYLARGVYRESLLILGAYRHTYVDKKHPLSPVLAELNRERLLQSLSLKRMSFDDVSEMIKGVLKQDDVPREFCKLIYEKTQGNPFFVEEVIKSLKEEGVIYRENDKWKVRDVSKIKFPETVKDVIKTRISRLDDECQHVLTLASFVGKDFMFEALHGVAGIEEDKLVEIMEKMLKSGMIKESVIRGEDMYSFVDVIVRDVVYEEVSRLKRKRLHGVVASALENVHTEKIDEHLGELAYHFLEGGDEEKALAYFFKAGDKAEKVYAHNEAFSYLQHALGLLEEKRGNVKEKAQVVERLGVLKLHMGEADAGIEYLKRSLALWNQLGDKKNVARLHVTIASWFWQFASDRDKASEHHRTALEMLEKEPESVELAKLYEDVSHMLWRTGESTEALSWAQKAFELAKRLGDHEVLVGCYNDLGTLSMMSGEFEKASEYYEQGLKIALENNIVAYAITFYNNLSELYGASGEFQKRFETAQKGSEFTKRVGSLPGSAWLDSMLAECYFHMGEVWKATSMSEDILAQDKRTNYTTHISIVMSGLGRCHQFLGEWDKSLQYLVEARDIAREIREYQFSAFAILSLGELYMEMEDYEQAEKHLKESDSIYEKAGDALAQLTYTYPALSKLYLKKGEIEKAEALIEKIYESATSTKNRLVIPYADMLKGMLFRERKNWEQSTQHFEKSLQGCKSLDLQKWAVQHFAELLYEYGLMHMERSEEGDEGKAGSLLRQALEIYRKMDTKKRVEKTKSKLACLETEREMVEPETVAEVALPTHITTGYTELDDLLSGGIPRDYAVMLTSPSCDERDIIIKRFLEAGPREGQITFQVTAKASGAKSLAEDFQSNFYLFMCNPEADAIIRSLPNVFKLKGVENLNDINIALTSAFRNLDKSPKGTRRICIEIISDVLLQHHTVQTRRWLNALVPKLKSKGFTTLAVMDSEIHPQQEIRAIVGVFEGEISIYEKATEKGLEKFLQIKKMTNKEYSKSELSLQKEKLRE